MKKTTVSMTAILAVTTVLAAGLTVLPNPVQEAQADVCTYDNEGNIAGTNNICVAAIGNDIDIEDSANFGLPYGQKMATSEGISVPPFSDDSD
jgi:hypothetical protein